MCLARCRLVQVVQFSVVKLSLVYSTVQCNVGLGVMITKDDAPAGVTVSADHNLVVNLKTVVMKCNGDILVH